MKNQLQQITNIILLTIIVIINGCGGGGSSSTASATQSLGGNVIDGYITGANVCLDTNNNGVCDTGEPSATSTANGAYTLSYPSGTNVSKLNVIVDVPAGAVDADNPNTPIAKSYQLQAPASNSTSVTPLTTLIVSTIKTNPTLTVQAAATQVATAMGLPTANLLQDYVATASTGIKNVAQMANAVIQNSGMSGNVTTATLTATLAIVQQYATLAYTATSGVQTIISNAGSSAANGALLTTVPATTYSQADALTIYNKLSTIRANAGVGLLNQNSNLDQAASSHASFLVNNSLASNGSYLYSLQSGILGGHYENPTLTGYTGQTPQSRATAAGYNGTVTELETFGSTSGTVCINSIENSVYHLSALLSPYLDLGLVFNNGTNGATVCNVQLGVGTSALGQYPPTGTYAFYPYSGETNVPPTFYNQAESPTPAPDLAIAGHPIIFSFYNLTNKTLNSTDIVIHTFTVSAIGTTIPVRILAQAGVTSDGPILVADNNLAGPGFVSALPISSLIANTTYSVSLTGSVKGTTVTQSWSFTTGSAN